jgi:hypothetical protein
MQEPTAQVGSQAVRELNFTIALESGTRTAKLIAYDRDR